METQHQHRSGCSDGPYYRVCGPDLLDRYHQDPRPHHGEGR